MFSRHCIVFDLNVLGSSESLLATFRVEFWIDSASTSWKPCFAELYSNKSLASKLAINILQAIQRKRDVIDEAFPSYVAIQFHSRHRGCAEQLQ